MMVQTKNKLRTVTFLSREQIDFLDKLGNDAVFSQNYKLSRVEILSGLVDMLMALGINLKEINLKKEGFVKGVLKIITDHKQNEK